MNYYKDKQNNVHVLEDAQFTYLLPEGSKEITEAQANKILDKLNKPKPEDIISQRNALLAQTDWTQVADVTLSKKQSDAYKKYRQELRDVTSQEGFPLNVIWPELNK